MFLIIIKKPDITDRTVTDYEAENSSWHVEWFVC